MENNLTKIHSNIFDKTYSSVKKVYMNLNSVKDNQQNYSLFQALSSLVNLEILELDFGIDSITSIPDNAFTTEKGIQQNLSEISINGRIQSVGQLAFAQLPNLQRLTLLNEITTIGSQSFEFKDKSYNELEIDLSFNRLTSTGFEWNALSNIKRPVNLILTENKIKYLDESVFRAFIDANENNRVVLTKNPLNCSDCRSYWVVERRTDLINRIEDPKCILGESFWDYQWKCASDNSTDNPCSDGNQGCNSFLSLELSLILSLFVIFKVIIT